MGALLRWLHSQPALSGEDDTPCHSLDQVRQLTLAAIEDCTTVQCERLRTSLAHAQDVQQLFLLRGEIFQAVARTHCQSEAARRINALLPAFDGWLPERALTRV